MARTKKADEAAKKKEERTRALAELQMPDDGWDEDDSGHENYIKRDKRGRPTVMTKQTLDKLRVAFKFGCPDEEACIYAGIDPQTLYTYCKKYPDFSSEKEELKQSPVLIARSTVVNALKSSTPDAWEYLRRKRKKEFAEAKIEIPTDETVTADDLEKLDRGDIQVIGGGKKPAPIKIKKFKK
ncbi:MAG: hypothetical protein PHO56_02200 [Patescibacteria group bacterium]|nr:hypothetical protein [Patescibacteria group bacterium]